MTLPFERRYAVINARAFLRSLLNPKETPKVPKSVREHAYWVLKHFPTEFDMERVESAFGSSAVENDE